MTTFNRAELAHILETRWRNGEAVEGVGVNAWIEFRFRITPEMLDALMRGTFVFEDGHRARLGVVHITDDGYAEPTLEEVHSVMPR